MRMTGALSCLLLLGACSGSLALRSGVPAPAPSASGSANSTANSISSGSNGVRANISSGSGPLFGVIVIGVMIADGVDYVRGTGRWTRAAPPLAEDRKINIQDCTRPIEYSAGNISCR